MTSQDSYGVLIVGVSYRILIKPEVLRGFRFWEQGLQAGLGGRGGAAFSCLGVLGEVAGWRGGRDAATRLERLTPTKLETPTNPGTGLPRGVMEISMDTATKYCRLDLMSAAWAFRDSQSCRLRALGSKKFDQQHGNPKPTPKV